MKYRLLPCLIIALLQTISLSARNYYVSSSGNNANSGLTEATAWQTIAKVNSSFSSMAAGDSILFKRGDTFFGSLIVGKSGTSALPIVIDAYGSGAKPVISGFINVSTWVSVGNGIYQALVSGAKNTLNMVTINNVPQALGRYPNITDANGGYLTYEAFAGTTSITDNEMSGSTSWVGAELVVRKKLWVLDRCKVNTQSGGIFTFTNLTTSPVETGQEGFGYFIQNDPRTLDKMGEWYFNPTTKYLQVYFGTASPSSYVVKASGLDTLLYIGSKNYINIKNLAFDGPNANAMLAITCSYINIQNCDFTNSGSHALNMQAVSNLLIENCTTNNILSNSIFIWNSKTTNVTIRGCSLKNTGLLHGMGQSAGGSYKAIYAYVSSNLLIEYNKVDTTGYVGIEFQGSNVTVKNNVVNYYDFIKDDAGGIYSYASGTDANPGPVFTNRVVNNNIVMNGIGAPYGRTNQEKMYVSGIYLDGRSMNVSILNNTIFNIGKNGIHCNNPSGVTVRGNTCYNTLNAMSVMRWATIGVLGTVTIKNNIFYPKLEAQRNFYYTNNGINTPVANTINGTIAALGSIDSNYYSNVSQAGFNFEFYGGTGTSSPLSLEGWRANGAHDNNGKKAAKLPAAYKINSLVGANKFSNGAFTSTISGLTLSGTSTTATWDNTGKINGGSLMFSFSSPTSSRYSFVHAPMGAISSAKKYLLRFSTFGTTQQGIVRGYIRKTASPYTALTPIQLKSFATGRKDHEFLFSAPATDAGGSFVIEIEQNSGTTYIDNVEFYEVDATLYDFNLQLRFEYNDTKLARAVALDSRYTGVDGTVYTGSVTLQPFTSLILVRDTGAMALSATVSATTIKCYSDSATVTVAASGGSGPYTGTGSFKVIAGTYTYTVRDAAGATASSTITITRPLAPLVAAANAGTITVAGGTTTITVSATGGTAPYTGTGTFTVSAGTYTYTVTDANGCTSSITKTVAAGPVSYTLSITINPTTGGTVTGAGSYASGATATMTATPAAGYVFTGWSGAATGTSTTTTVAMTANKSVTATFAVATTTYVLTVTASPTTGGTVTGGGSYSSGATATLTATPAAGYVFTGWSGAATGTSTTTTVAMTANKSVTATFAVATTTYVLTVTASPTTGGTVTGGGSYASGATATLTATPAAGYIFTGWSGAVTGTATTVTVAMTANKTVTATFTPVTYTLTVVKSPVDGGTVTGAGSYASGATATLTATPIAGYAFAGWSGAVTGTATTITVSMTANKTVTATFTTIATTTYTLATIASPTAGGTVTGAGTYSPGTRVSIAATPATGYTFTGWSGATTGTVTPNSVLMNGNKTVTAAFAPINYILTATASPTAGGTVTGGGSYAYGTNATLTAVPAAGYIFSGWSGAATGTAATVTVSMTANKSITATFTAVAATYTLTATASPTAGGTVTGAGTYASGATATLTATPAAGYTFSGWSGAATGTAATVTVSMTANKSVTATFTRITYTLTATSSPTTGGTVTGAGTYTSGTTATLTATPAAGYTFSGWSGAATGTTATVTVSMTANKSVTATFTALPTFVLVTVASPTAGGSVTGAGNYASGATASVTATPAAGYRFTGWSGALTGTATTRTIVMDGNKSVTANFAVVTTTFTLTATTSPTAGGTVTGAGTYTSGATATLTATPAAGYTFTGWSGAVTGTATTVTVSMTANKSVTATFAPNTTLRIEDDLLGTNGLCSIQGTVSSNSGANNGRSINLTNSLAQGLNWNVNAGATAPYNLTWRYANGSTSNTFYMKLIINGVTVEDSVPFPKTTGSSTFLTTTGNYTLQAGANTVRLESIEARATADIDWMEVTGYNPAANSCPAARPASPVTSTISSVEKQTIGVYPNPAAGRINIGFTVTETQRIGFVILDAAGNPVARTKGQIYTAGYNVQPYDMQGKAPGIYTVLASGDKNFKVAYKFIVMQ